MKKITFTLLFMALITAIYAQDVRFGLTAGPNLSTGRITYGDSEGDYEIKQPGYVVGFHIGGFAELRLADKINLRPELLYTQLGYKFATEEDVDGWRLKSSYITLPILAEYAINERLKAGLGTYFAANLVAKGKSIASADADLEDYPDDWYEYYTIERGEEYKTFDVGLEAGFSYQIQPKIGINLRYSHGLANMWDHGGGGYNRSFRLGISYTIR